MQFMKVCKEKPDDMASLDAISLVPGEKQGQFGNRRRAPMGSAPASARSAIGLGLNGPGGAPFGGKSFGGGSMGQFQDPRRSSEEYFAASIPRAVLGSIPFPRHPLGRINGISGPPLQVAGRRDGDVPQRSCGTKADSVAPNFVPNRAEASQRGGDQISRAIITQKVSAADALRELKNFCDPRVVFSKPFQFNIFVNLLATAGSKEGSWVSLFSLIDQPSIAYVDVRRCKILTVFLSWSPV
jgi:hypothetical protein